MPVTVWRVWAGWRRVLAGLRWKPSSAVICGTARVRDRGDMGVAGKCQVVGIAGVARVDAAGEAREAAVEAVGGEVGERG